MQGNVIGQSGGDFKVKEAIKKALIKKGITVLDDDKFISYADKIEDLNIVNPKIKLKSNQRPLFYIEDGSSSNTINMASDTTTINVNGYDFSNQTDLSYCFNNLSTIEKIIGEIYADNVTTFYYMFNACAALNTMPKIYNSDKVTNIECMFNSCYVLTTIPEIDFSSVVNLKNAFSNCNNLINLGGFINLGKAYLTTVIANKNEYILNISYSNINHDNLMNVINGLYDIAGKGVRQQTLNIGSRNLRKLSAEEIAIATNKGWAVA